MQEQHLDQTTANTGEMSAEKLILRDDPLRELLNPALQEFQELVRQGSVITETQAQSILPRESVLAAFQLSARQLSCLAQIIEMVNNAGTPAENRETSLVFALLPLVAGQIRANKYRSDEDNAFLVAYEKSRTEDDRQLHRWFEGITQFFYALADTDRFPSAHEYLYATDAWELVQDLLREIEALELQKIEAEERTAEDALEATIASKKQQMSNMLQSSHVRPEHVKSLIDVVEIHFSFRELPLAAYADLIHGLHLVFDAVFNKTGSAQFEQYAFSRIPFFTQQGMIETVAVRTEDLCAVLESDGEELLKVFLLAREGMLHGINWYGDFPHSVEEKNFETRMKKMLRPLTSLMAGSVEQQRFCQYDLFRLATQYSYIHDGGHDFSQVAAFCDFTSENIGVLNGAISAQLVTLQHFFTTSREEARRISRDILRGIGTNENFRRDALQLIEDIRMMIVERPGDIAATFLDREIAGAVKSNIHTVALFLSLAAICNEKRLAVKVKNRIPHLRILLEKLDTLGKGALSGILMPYATHTVKTLGVSLDDYYGNTELVTEVRRVIDQFFEFQRHPELLEGRTPDQVIINGILTYGDYGVGKTFLMQCVEGEYGFRAFPISTEIFIKEKKSPILSHDEIVAYSEQVFSHAIAASHSSPVLLTIDELFEFAADRIAYPGSEMVTNYHLRKIEEIRKGYPGIFLMANSNCFDELDPGVKRPGRFDVRRTIEPMDKESFKQLIDATLLLETQSCYQPEELNAMADSAIGLTPFAAIQAIANFCRLRQAHGVVGIPAVTDIVAALVGMQELQRSTKR